MIDVLKAEKLNFDFADILKKNFIYREYIFNNPTYIDGLIVVLSQYLKIQGAIWEDLIFKKSHGSTEKYWPNKDTIERFFQFDEKLFFYGSNLQ